MARQRGIGPAEGFVSSIPAGSKAVGAILLWHMHKGPLLVIDFLLEEHTTLEGREPVADWEKG